MPFNFTHTILRRVRMLHDDELGEGPVLYWMSREQRAEDSWPLLAAADAAVSLDRPLMCAFCFSPFFLDAQARHYAFMIRGLEETCSRLLKQNVKMIFMYGNPGASIASLASALNAALLITDFDPFPEKRSWKKELLENIKVPVYEVDGHNIIPAWIASPKREYSAATFRRKVHPLLPAYLEEFPPFPALRSPEDIEEGLALPLKKATAQIGADSSGSSINWISPGASNANAAMYHFFSVKLSEYDTRRNNPALPGVSDLSPWLHFGQLAPQRVALEAMKEPSSPARDAFLEELIVRRELADNFCFYEPLAGKYEGLPEWARKTLALHAQDSRPHLYSFEELEEARTADPLWNAAQKEMVCRGKMHGWMRMYWAKKILEWTESPQEAFEHAMVLNDRYELDGRDPNGIVGISWAIGGLHDRPWVKRPVFGMIRYMNDRGAARKFRVKEYIESIEAFIATNEREERPGS